MAFDGVEPLGVSPHGASVSSAKIRLMKDGVLAISAVFNSEKITGGTLPAAHNHLVVLELTNRITPHAPALRAVLRESWACLGTTWCSTVCCQACKREVLGRCVIKNAIWSARMRRLRRMKSSHRLGT